MPVTQKKLTTNSYTGLSLIIWNIPKEQVQTLEKTKNILQIQNVRILFPKPIL